MDMDVDEPALFDLLTVPIDVHSTDRIFECENYIPYVQRPSSCTETCARVLGFITQETFQQCATLQRNAPNPTIQTTVEASLSLSVNTNVSLRNITLEEVYAVIPPNTGIMVCSSRPQGPGHTMILSRSPNDPLLLDPSTGITYIGQANIQQHVQAENFISHLVPVIPRGTPYIVTPWGGAKPTLIMVNITTINQDKYAVLGNVASKTFTTFRKNVPLILHHIDFSALKTMKSNKATLIYGNGHTMILLKQTKLILLDPISDLKIVGYSEIMKYLETFPSILALSNPRTKTKTKSKYKSTNLKTYRV